LGIADFPDGAIMIGTQFEALIPWPEGKPASQSRDDLLDVDNDDEEEQEYEEQQQQQQ